MQNAGIFIGCARWSIPKTEADAFPAAGTHLERYAAHFNAVEINSSFYRAHRPQTYARWAGSVPDGFRFSVKIPRTMTHQRKLAGCEDALDSFLGEASRLGAHQGPLLVQLPPKLAFHEDVAESFFRALRQRFEGGVACEPRHPSWFEDGAEDLLRRFRVARVAADPALCGAAAQPGDWGKIAYYRWHGSPRVYYSAYTPDALAALAERIIAHRAQGVEVWCIFDNTAAGAATANALFLQENLLGADLIPTRTQGNGTPDETTRDALPQAAGRLLDAERSG